MTDIGYEYGLIPEERYERFTHKKQQIQDEIKRIEKIIIKPDEAIQQVIEEQNGTPLKEAVRATDLLRRPEMKYELLKPFVPRETNLPAEVEEQVEIQVKYEGYIKKSNQQVEKMRKMDNKYIPEHIDYDDISGIASEAREKLKQVRPLSVGQASRISGVNPSDISILLVYIEQGVRSKVSNE